MVCGLLFDLFTNNIRTTGLKNKDSREPKSISAIIFIILRYWHIAVVRAVAHCPESRSAHDHDVLIEFPIASVRRVARQVAERAG